MSMPLFLSPVSVPPALDLGESPTLRCNLTALWPKESDKAAHISVDDSG